MNTIESEGPPLRVLNTSQTYNEEWPPLDETESKLGSALKNVKLLAGNSHPKLAKLVASHLGMSLSPCDITYFRNTETRIKNTTDESETFRGKDIFIIQTGCYDHSEKAKERFGMTLNINDYIMETLLMMDACRRGSCNSISLIIPFYPYARQDKKDTSRAPISASVVAQLFQSQGLDRIVCFDLHNSCIQGLFNDPFRRCCDNLYATKLLRSWLMEHVFHASERGRGAYVDKFVVIAPDEGAVTKTRIIANTLGLPFFNMSKVRDYSKENKVEQLVLMAAPEMIADRPAGTLLQGKIPLIVDDMFDTCGTLIAAVECLMEYGASSVIAAATHGIFSGPALDRINGCDALRLVLVSDSLPQFRHTEQCRKIKVYSIAQMLAEVVKRIATNHSLSPLF